MEVRHAKGRSRYELVAGGQVVAVADYRERKGVLVFDHTEVSQRLRGQGLGERLLRGALDDVRARGKDIVPTCWYVARFIDDHPEYGDLLAA